MRVLAESLSGVSEDGASECGESANGPSASGPSAAGPLAVGAETALASPDGDTDADGALDGVAADGAWLEAGEGIGEDMVGEPDDVGDALGLAEGAPDGDGEGALLETRRTKVERNERRIQVLEFILAMCFGTWNCATNVSLCCKTVSLRIVCL